MDVCVIRFKVVAHPRKARINWLGSIKENCQVTYLNVLAEGSGARLWRLQNVAAVSKNLFSLSELSFGHYKATIID